MMSGLKENGAIRRRKILGFIVAATASVYGFAGATEDHLQMEPMALVDALREGGHVIVMRYASTETDYADQIDAVMGECATQRVLSEAGWAEAKTIGADFERLAIPIGPVISSEYCRAWQSADLAFGRYKTNSDLNFAPAKDYSDAQIATMKDRVTPHLSRLPQDGNTVLVGHDDPFQAATGIYPEPMGVMFVLRPLENGRFDFLGAIAPDEWAEIP